MKAETLPRYLAKRRTLWLFFEIMNKVSCLLKILLSLLSCLFSTDTSVHISFTMKVFKTYNIFNRTNAFWLKDYSRYGLYSIVKFEEALFKNGTTTSVTETPSVDKLISYVCFQALGNIFYYTSYYFCFWFQQHKRQNWPILLKNC